MLPEPDQRGHLEISLRRVEQLFNSLDPSPFRDRDLDAEAESYLVNWAQELPRDAALSMSLHLAELEGASTDWIGESIQRYFTERRRLKLAELHALLRQGRSSLVIGLAFLVSCLLLSQWLQGLMPHGMVASVVRESFMVIGWVALWRPLEIYLYDWWPLWHKAQLLGRMSAMPVRVIPGAASNKS